MAARIIARTSQETTPLLACLRQKLTGHVPFLRTGSEPVRSDCQKMSMKALIVALLRDSWISEKLYGIRDRTGSMAPAKRVC